MPVGDPSEAAAGRVVVGGTGVQGVERDVKETMEGS